MVDDDFSNLRELANSDADYADAVAAYLAALEIDADDQEEGIEW